MSSLIGLSLLAAWAAPTLVGSGVAGWMALEGRSSAASISSWQACQSELIEEVRIGAIDGPDELVFSHINSLAVGESGSIYVADADLISIREFSPDGGFVREIGGRGEGPGEILSITGISVLPDGRLATWDRRNRRVSVFGTDGEFDETIRVDAVRPPYPFGERAFLTDSAGIYYFRVIAGQSSSRPDPQDWAAARYGYAQVSPEGTILDTLVAPRFSEATAAAEPIMINTLAGDLSPFPEQMLDALSPFGHLVAGYNETYSFSILRPAGAKEVVREGFQPVEVAAGERAEWQARVEFSERRSGVSFRDVPSRKPAYRDLWVDSDGRIWVHPYTEATEQGEPIPEPYIRGSEPRITWAEPSLRDVFSPDGQFLRCLRVPEYSRVAASRGSLAWGIVRGTFDEEYVVRWRIE